MPGHIKTARQVMLIHINMIQHSCAPRHTDTHARIHTRTYMPQAHDRTQITHTHPHIYRFANKDTHTNACINIFAYAFTRTRISWHLTPTLKMRTAVISRLRIDVINLFASIDFSLNGQSGLSGIYLTFFMRAIIAH